MWDCHMHCQFSGDSTAKPEEMIEAAMENKLDGVYFTDHHDEDYPKTVDEPDFLLDIPNYYEAIHRLASQYNKEDFEVRTGIELGLQAHLFDTLPEKVKDVPFDIVIGSTHVAEHMDPYYGKFYEGRSEKEAYYAYFEATLENAKAFDCYDTYAHLDYVVRYGPNKNKNYSYEQYADVLDAILETLIKKEKSLELNTSGWKYGLSSPHPCVGVWKRYKELGGELLTIGSDAHSPAFVGYDFLKAKELLTGLGFTSYTVYENHCPKQYPFES